MLYYTPAQSAFLLRFVRFRVLFAAILLSICFVCSQPINAATYSVTTTVASDLFEVQTVTSRIWGLNDFGQLGLGNTRSPQITPQTLFGFTDITVFGGGFVHSVALRADGTLLTAGSDIYGQLGDGVIGGRIQTTFAAVTDGNIANITAVSGGVNHNLALRSDGTIWAWGQGTSGQLGNGMSENSGTPVQVGANIAGFDRQIIQISAGYHNLALTADGKVWAWGANNYGQLGNDTVGNSSTPVPVLTASGGLQLSGVAQISAGEFHSVALKTDGSVVVWGNNEYGQVGNNTLINSVPFPTATATTMGIVTSISAGAYHTVALKADGDVWAWGYGGDGAIGDNNPADALVPRRTTIANVVRIEAHGAYHTLARTRSGQIFAWGSNTYGEIGNGTIINQLIPLNISAAAGTGGNLGTNIAVFGAGVFSSFALNAPQATTPTGASTLRGDQFSIIFPASTVAGTTEIRIIDPTATGLTVPAGYTILANSTGYDITTNAAFTGAATVCLNVSTVVDPPTFRRLYILHDDNGDGTFDIAGVTRDYQRRQICRPTTSFSPFVLAVGPLLPTAASVSVSGRVMTATGRAILNATITLTNSLGETFTRRANPNGRFTFESLTAGETYIFNVAAKRYTFAAQVITVTEDLTDVNFVAQ